MKNLLFILAITCVINLSFSQSEKGIGIRAGANISTLTNSDLDAKTNVYLGVFYQVRFSELYALQPELGYSNQGGITKENNPVYIEYITLGATNKFFIAPAQGLYISITPGFDFDIDDTFFGISNSDDNLFDGNDATFIDFSISFGLGFELKNGLSFDARYKQGLIDVYSDAFHSFDSELYEAKNQFNAVFQIGIAYKFNLTKNK
tara:strand:+ start:39813 stop:40427 length:615 start_codon:yes stop_codon:yes gene_type:complete